MKKTTLLTFFLIAINFASCQLKKDRVCTCTFDNGSVSSITYYDSKKSNAERYCSENNSQRKYTSNLGVDTTYDRSTCVLDVLDTDSI